MSNSNAVFQKIVEEGSSHSERKKEALNFLNDQIDIDSINRSMNVSSFLLDIIVNKEDRVKIFDNFLRALNGLSIDKS